jgi:hypothetical protein
MCHVSPPACSGNRAAGSASNTAPHLSRSQLRASTDLSASTRHLPVRDAAVREVVAGAEDAPEIVVVGFRFERKLAHVPMILSKRFRTVVAQFFYRDRFLHLIDHALPLIGVVATHLIPGERSAVQLQQNVPQRLEIVSTRLCYGVSV